MSGQTLYYDEKQNIVDNFISRVNIYEPLIPFDFDLRGYKRYLSENKIANDHITGDTVKQFLNIPRL